MKIKSLIFYGAAAIGLSVPALAQNMTCTATPPAAATVRQGGVAELVGDIFVSCTGGTPVTTGAFPTVNVSMFFNTAVTSRIVATGTPPITEAVLIIDNPTALQQIPCATTICNNTDTIFQGRYESFNSLSWSNIPVNPPGPGVQRILRFKNVRINTNNLPSNGTAIVFLSVTGAAVGSFANPQQTVAAVRPGLTLELRSPTDTAMASAVSYVACTSNNTELATNNAGAYSTPGGRSLLLKFSEAASFPTAFKRRLASTTLAEPLAILSQDNPAFTYNTESGFTNTTFPATNGLNRIGIADSGTTLRAVFTNIPSNVKLFVTTREVLTGSTLGVDASASTKARLTGTPGLPFTPLPNDSAADGGLRLVPPSGEVNWELLETDTNAVESVAFGVVVAFTGTPQPTAGTISVVGGFGPQTGGAAASATDLVPRHAGLSIPAPAFVINACRTTLLFQFLTNQSGFDTGLSVSNSSRDTLGTLPQTGRCVATFFPTPFNAANQALFPPLTSPVLQGGEQWTFTVSAQRPNFQGYMMTTCEFQFAHGYAFISDFGSTRLAQGYQALVVPDRLRVADPMTTSVSGSGEQLVH